MTKIGKVCITVLCALTLVFASGCEETPLSLLLPAHEGEQVQTPTQGDEETPTPTPPTQESQTDGKQETEQDQEQEEQEEPPVSPPQAEEKITVRFIFFDESSVTKEFDKGGIVTLADVPNFTEEAGYYYAWNLDGIPLLEEVDYTQTRYKTLSSADEFLQIQENEKYFLQEDITLSNVFTLPAFQGVIEGNGKTLKIENATKTVFESFCGTMKNLNVQATFVGTTALNGQTTAKECALFKELTGNATFQNCHFTVEFTASATENKPSAGLALNIQNASFENCSLETKADGLQYIYAVCEKKSASVTLAGLTVVKKDLEDYKICE